MEKWESKTVIDTPTEKNGGSLTPWLRLSIRFWNKSNARYTLATVVEYDSSWWSTLLAKLNKFNSVDFVESGCFLSPECRSNVGRAFDLVASAYGPWERTLTAIGFGSVRVLTKVRVRFEFFTSAENLVQFLYSQFWAMIGSVLYEFGCLTVLNFTVSQWSQNRSLLFVN